MNELVQKARNITEYISYELRDLPKEDFYMVVSYIGEHLRAKVASELQAAYTAELLKSYQSNPVESNIENPEVTDE